MCGIVGYVGSAEARPILLDSLERVTYRGYDSFGVASFDGDGLEVFKAIGPVDQHREEARVKGTIGIGHTRWATVGGVSQCNAHPHLDCTGRIAIVHNGDIDNYVALRERLRAEGHAFRSETDSEVIVHLIEAHLAYGIVGAVQKTMEELQGCYAIVALDTESQSLVAARRESPLVLGIGDDETFVASDAAALLPYTRYVVYPQDGDVVLMETGGVSIWNNGQSVERPSRYLEWDITRIEKAGYERFMLKEIWEQPQVLRDTLAACAEGVPWMSPADQFTEALFLGCGTSYYAAMVGANLFSRFTRFPASAQVASEFDSGRGLSHALTVALSQSGETADTLAALRLADHLGHRTIGVTNVPESSITRTAQAAILTHAGPEVAVAATKTFLSQLIVLGLLTAQFARNRDLSRQALQALEQVPDLVQYTLMREDEARAMGKCLAGYNNLFFIGKGMNLPVVMEGALKFKEVAYVHGEGFAAGELKHGPFALLGPDVPVVALVANDEHAPRLLTAIKEIEARGSPVFVITDRPTREIEGLARGVLSLPECDDSLATVFTATVALQLLAYYCALARGCPIDRPRNLAKSVTVP